MAFGVHICTNSAPDHPGLLQVSPGWVSASLIAQQCVLFEPERIDHLGDGHNRSSGGGTRQVLGFAARATQVRARFGNT